MQRSFLTVINGCGPCPHRFPQPCSQTVRQQKAAVSTRDPSKGDPPATPPPPPAPQGKDLHLLFFGAGSPVLMRGGCF